MPDIDNMQELAVALELNLQELLECHVYQKEEEKGGLRKYCRRHWHMHR